MVSSQERAGIEVIALVASAGGLEALSAVVHDLPTDLSAAVVVQQHLTVPASGLIELLGRRTRHEVVWVVDGAVAGSGRVSVCPPGMRMEILPDGTCLLAARERYGDQPHDLLLASLADSYGPRALAVVLTGGGSDGAVGTAALKAAGGVVIAQSEDTAEHPSMPRAAAEAGADLVLPLYEIAGVVADIVRGGPLPRPHEEAQAVRAVFGDVGEAAALARDVDWASTPLGSVCEWSEATRTVVRHVAAALREHGSATLDGHCCHYAALPGSWSTVTQPAQSRHHDLPGGGYRGHALPRTGQHRRAISA